MSSFTDKTESRVYFIILVITFLLLPIYFYSIVNLPDLPNTMDTHTQNIITNDIILIHYSKNIISNITLFKHNHQNETIKYYDNFSVMYLVEGYSFFDTEDWYSLMYENDNNYMIFLYYNTESYIKDQDRLMKLLNRVNSHQLKLLIICGFGTSYSEGRNVMLSYMFKYEKIMLNNCNFNYIAIVDEDIRLHGFDETNNNVIHLNNIFDYNNVLNDFYSNFLMKYNPIIGLPHRIDARGFQILPKIPKQHLGYKYMKIQEFDPMIAYYSRPLLNNNFLFPLTDKYDYKCWWYGPLIMHIKLRMLFPFDKYDAAIMYMKMAVTNPGHGSYPKGCTKPGQGSLWYTEFSQWINKYLNVNTSNTINCNANTWTSFIKHNKIMLKNMSLQKYNYSKNNPKHYFDEFDLCI
eukprot:437509_1